MDSLRLSPLGHTWLLDIDGTLCKHNGYKEDGRDEILPGVKEFFMGLPPEDMVILITSRNSEYQDVTERFLKENGLRYDAIIYNAPYGERILVNDRKPSGLETGLVWSLRRNRFDLAYTIDQRL